MSSSLIPAAPRHSPGLLSAVDTGKFRWIWKVIDYSTLALLTESYYLRGPLAATDIRPLNSKKTFSELKDNLKAWIDYLMLFEIDEKYLVQIVPIFFKICRKQGLIVSLLKSQSVLTDVSWCRIMIDSEGVLFYSKTISGLLLLSASSSRWTMSVCSRDELEIPNNFPFLMYSLSADV